MRDVNLRVPKTFGERTNTYIKEPKKKYFLVVEGSKTEKDYFEGIFNYRQELGINELTDIIVVEREDANGTDSHPKHLLSAILKRIGKSEVSEDYKRLDYDEKTDEIFLVFDRDKGNFSRGQFDDIYQKCDEYHLNIAFTNPNFEFWLLLHLPDISQYNNKDLLANEKVNRGKRRFIEKELSYRLTGYKKKNIHFERFKDNIDLYRKQ